MESLRMAQGWLRGAQGLSMALFAAAFVVLLILQRVRPLRRLVEPGLPHLVRNASLAGTAFALLGVLQIPLLEPVSRWAMERQVGLLFRLPVSSGVRTVLGIILLDYTLWFWHWMNHRVPLFWRFHLVHHADRDLDTSTGMRFHFGELLLSAGYRAIQIVVLGASQEALSVWLSLLTLSVLFHHSNLRLPIAVERVLVRVVVTPRMHGIHHSDRLVEADSNWSSLLSVWDVLHGTAVFGIPQDELVIGVPAWSVERDVGFVSMTAAPFRRQKDDWAGTREAPPRHRAAPETKTLAE